MKNRTFFITGACIAILVGIGLTFHAIKPAESQSASAIIPQEMISGFARPDIIQALYDGDLAELNKDKVRNFLYINVIVEATSSQDAFYRMNQAELLIDPQLSFIASRIKATSSDVQKYIFNIGINTAASTLGEFLKNRSDSNKNSKIDIVNEITSINKGLFNGSSEMALLKADAEYDAKKLMFLAPVDQSSFNRIYATIRQFVRHF